MSLLVLVDRIDYTRPFREHVQGRISARFRCDANSEPMYRTVDNVRLYFIDVSLYSPYSTKIEEVEYVVDDPKHWDPIVFSDDRDNDFREVLEVDREVPVIVKVWIGANIYEQRAWLTQMLENGHGPELTPAVKTAIQYLKAN